MYLAACVSTFVMRECARNFKLVTSDSQKPSKIDPATRNVPPLEFILQCNEPRLQFRRVIAIKRDHFSADVIYVSLEAEQLDHFPLIHERFVPGPEGNR